MRLGISRASALSVPVGGQQWPLEDEQDLGFSTALGGPLDPTLVSRRIHALLTPIGLPAFRCHDLRHGCATLLLRQGRSPLEVAKLLGHSDPTMVMRVYGHVAADSLRDAMTSLDGFARRAS
jgi:integrase